MPLAAFDLAQAAAERDNFMIMPAAVLALELDSRSIKPLLNFWNFIQLSLTPKFVVREFVALERDGLSYKCGPWESLAWLYPCLRFSQRYIQNENSLNGNFYTLS